MLIFEQWKAITSAFKYFCLAFAIFSLLWRRCRMWWPPNKRSCAPVAQKRRVNHVHILLIARDVQFVLSRLIPFDGTSFVLLDDPKWRWNAYYRPSTVKSCQFYELKYHEKFDCRDLESRMTKKSMKSAQARNLRKRIIQITDTQSKREIKPIFLL